MIELLVVIGVMLVLIGLLLPAIEGVHRSGQRSTQRLNFRAIIEALEAYRQDFRDYPRDPFALTDGINTTSISYTTSGGVSAVLPDLYRPLPLHTDPTLAMALLGLGPASTIGATSASFYPNGDVDGADGPGFKAKMSLVQATTLAAGASAGAPSITVSITVPTIPTMGTPPAFTVISLGGPGSVDAQIPITSASGSTITLARPLLGGPYPALQPCALLLPAGRTYEPYLPPDKFKVEYVTVPNQGHSSGSLAAEDSLPLPVLLDIWGGPILYFPAYNNYGTRLPNIAGAPSNTPTTTTTATYPTGFTPPVAGAIVTVGPIFGSPSPILANITRNAAVNNNNDTIPSIFWSGALGSWGVDPSGTSPNLTADPAVPLSQGQIQGILLKLGDVNGNNVIENAPLKETFNLQQPYFLVSPGPDGKFEDPTQDAINDKLTPSVSNAANYMPKSDDVYDFDQ